MRVVRIKYRAHEKSPVHQHPRGGVVFPTDAHFRFTYPDGKTEEIRKNAREFLTFTMHARIGARCRPRRCIINVIS